MKKEKSAFLYVKANPQKKSKRGGKPMVLVHPNGAKLKPSGERVANIRYWRRRIADGDDSVSIINEKKPVKKTASKKTKEKN